MLATNPVKGTAENDATLRIIGKGACGTVWASSEKGSALKREDGGPGRSLRNDFDMHRQVLQSFQELRNLGKLRQMHLKIQIPACYEFIESTDQNWWTVNQRRFPPGYMPCNILHSQRIPPFSEPTRKLLIDNYCPPKIAPEISTSEANKDCLIRPYLGRRRMQKPQTTSQFTAFSLRNYPLHVDQMESLGITTNNIHQYARMMAETLAVMHWIGEIDGNDIEFVLAPPDEDESGLSSPQTKSSVLGDHTMWVLDFDLCRKMTMDLEGVQQAVAAFWGNDPYYPRPDKDISLWKVFREHYLQMRSLRCDTRIGSC